MSSVGFLNLLYDCIAGAGNKGKKNGLLTNVLKKYGYVKNEAWSTQLGPSAHLSAGVQGLDFVLGL